MTISLDDLEEVKQWLRVDSNDDDTLIQMLIAAAKKYFKNATGKEYQDGNELATLYCLTLISDWYENREHVGKNAFGQTSEYIRPTLESIKLQIELEESEGETA